ncbi:MAG: hypothetical protein ACLFPQ_00230 [Candidatus Woesearchaeota archaeon]
MKKHSKTKKENNCEKEFKRSFSKYFMKRSRDDCQYNSGDFCKGGFLYFMGFLGAAIYYISTADSFWIGVLGFLKAIIWPLFLVLEALKFLGA